MSRVRPALCVLAGALAVGDAPAQNAPAPQEAVEYLEHPEGGDLVDTGRKLRTDGRGYYGVDINSVVDINVDAPKLKAALRARTQPGAATPNTKIASRLQSLQRAAAALEATVKDLGTVFDAWKKGDPQFGAKLGASARQRGAILGALQQARKQRLEQTMPADKAEFQAQTDFDVVLSRPPLDLGYNWAELKRLFKEELDAADADLVKALETERQFAADIGIQAHLVSKGSSQGLPIFLPNYNTERAGPRTPYEKMKYAASQAELDMLKQYEDMATKMRDAKNASDALKQVLQAQFAQLRADFDKIAAGAQAALAKFQADVGNLQTWGSAEKRKVWLDSVAAALEATPEGRKARQAWTEVEGALDEAKDDLDALRAYADLRTTTAGQDATQALDTVLRTLNALRVRDSSLRALDENVWRARADKVRAFVAAVEALPAAVRPRLTAPDSPYAALKAARDALATFADAVKETGRAVKEWLTGVFTVQGAQDVAELPVPAGNRRQAIADNAQLGTSINLATIPGARNPGDTVRVQYSFFQGQRDLEAGWTDSFLLQAYGWSSEVIASLAFARQAHAATWKPTAAMSWLASYRDWPASGKSGLGSPWYSSLSVGVSAMPLHSAEGQDVQIGLAPTLGFINNRILLGYGVNLQADRNKGFAFLSVRLVSFPGLSSPAVGVAP